MLAILILKFIFSIKGLLYVSVIAFLTWLLTGYPEWRQSKRKVPPKKETKDDIMPAPAPEDIDNKAILKDEKTTVPSSKSSTPTEKLSLAHYILVTPFAALYIVGRVIIDTIRFSIYYTIWSCEKTLPHLDDWLFEFATIFIPKAYNRTELWWAERGKPACIRYYAYTQQHIVPYTIHGLEVFFIGTYKVMCAIQTIIVEFIATWKRFVDRHDWHQLAIDLSDIAYKTCWVPTAWIVTRTIHLCKITYVGVRAMVTSIANELKWICMIAVPSVYNYVASTRLAQFTYRGLIIVAEGAQWGCVCLNEYLLTPTIGRFLTFLVRSIDSLILLLQQRTIQEKLERIYRLVAPHVVSMFMDCAAIINDFIVGSYHVYKELVFPTYKLFMKHVMPRLTIAYKAAAANLAGWYNAHIYPAWLLIYPYLNAPLLWMYTNLTLPVYREVYNIVATFISYITQHLSAQLWNLGAKLVVMTRVYAQYIYSFIQFWLLKQAPVLAGFIQSSYEKIIQVCDWGALQQDIVSTISIMYNWISKQSNLIYYSLERSLSSWAEEQQSISGTNTSGKQKIV
jgi:hypothetical protein